MNEIAVIGAGAWGTALSIVLGRTEAHRIRLWAHEKDVCESITQRRVNEKFLPGQIIPPSVTPYNNLAEALQNANIVVSVMPSQHCRHLFEQMLPHLRADTMIVSATKGLEENSLLRMTEVIAQVVKGGAGRAPRIGALSGPSFALEAARGDPTAIAFATHDADLARSIQQQFSHASFRVYTNDDPIGVELVACGGKAETMAGLAGLGDLVLTCTGGLSRNRSVGVELGRGRKLPEILAAMHGTVAEGVFTTTAAVGLAHAHAVEVPITQQMHAILHQGKPPREAIFELMTRSGKSETLRP
jgi:glycerol-3-phosphate dehydrogenase (NAD(P)+)